MKKQLNGMTTPPYPEGTLDTFGFPVESRLAARRAVLWPRLPKVAFLGVKNDVFQPQQPPRGPPCGWINTKKLCFSCPAMMVSKILDNVSKKLILGQKTGFFAPKRTTLAIWGLITAHQAVKWEPTRKPKLSRVTSWCGQVMIPLSWVHRSPKMGVTWYQKNWIFGPKSAFFGPNRANLGLHMADILIFWSANWVGRFRRGLYLARHLSTL